mmetsp:Transcript_4700/g.7819  ORF Transcript_4700/g.7819 Transcript_4700/m.7819 type:complete len:700 (+) Transcript_4700:108-2207(+)|eukprot:CAMPEP_0119029934 /NCGR_PEP_ID=MMETSP1176-20130426/40774_1 /TAXON_ID=265551 /ORGANISM="Synedropsis recta cf, Strain CCMP1620" /LENGTH=699 /DNA_ID=CAMNT_0006986295 /DNA_START=100 /DNA_END=2199 /DNA_ORIENTATION=+
MSTVGNALLVGLMEKNVDACVSDFDHYRIHGGMAVETDYIISVKPTVDKDGVFDTFKVCKNYSAFRTLASQLKKAVEKKLRVNDNLTKEDKVMVQFVQSVDHLVESQKTRYLGKVNFNYVKSLSKQRAQILNDTLETILQRFPASIETGSASARAVAQIVETFFLTDHVQDNSDDEFESTLSDDGSNDSLSSSGLFKRIKNPMTPMKKLVKGIHKRTSSNKDAATPPQDRSVHVSLTSPVVPITRKHRRSIAVRAQDHELLLEAGSEANLLMDDDRSQQKLVPSYSNPIPTVAFAEGNQLGNLIENNQFVFLAIFIASVVGLKAASYASVTVDFDIALLLGFALFCVGLHMPRPSQSGIDTPAVSPKPVVAFAPPSKRKARSASVMVRRTLLVSPKAGIDADGTAVMTESELTEGEEDPLIKTPMDKFPEGAKLGSHLNCWSMPDHKNFMVRGPSYLEDKVKVPSGKFLLPARGVDLFLTDACPENIGTNSGIFGGALREKPTFLINYRLPWGVFISYFEIPDKFIPFVRQRYEFDYDGKIPDINKMTPGERGAARFLGADEATKNKTLKIVPVVVEGPWIVKSVVGGKPAIIGNKLPVTWIYEKASPGKALYLEADMDIVSSSAARGILSVTRSHTQILTLDLGFVVQGNQKDELPEQMLCGARNHGIDPLTASPLPPMKHQFLQSAMDEQSIVFGED